MINFSIVAEPCRSRARAKSGAKQSLMHFEHKHKIYHTVMMKLLCDWGDAASKNFTLRAGLLEIPRQANRG